MAERTTSDKQNNNPSTGLVKDSVRGIGSATAPSKMADLNMFLCWPLRAAIWEDTALAPSLAPIKLTRVGSPPNLLMCFYTELIHRQEFRIKHISLIHRFFKSSSRPSRLWSRTCTHSRANRWSFKPRFALPAAAISLPPNSPKTYGQGQN